MSNQFDNNDLVGGESSEAGWGEEPENGSDGSVSQTEAGEPSSDAGQPEMGATKRAFVTVDIPLEQSYSKGEKPYVLQRQIAGEGVNYDRPTTIQFPAHEDIAESEEFLYELFQDSHTMDLPRFDFREAIFRAGLMNLDTVHEQLSMFGYAVADDS